MMLTTACLLLSLGGCLPTGQLPSQTADTLRLEVGSPEVDGRIFPVHRARNRVYIGDATAPITTWTNELLLGDSAGVPVMRWITRGERLAPEANGATWELLQTYNARTLAPMAYSMTSSAGAYTRFHIDGNRVTGVRRSAGDAEEQPIDRVLHRLGFISSASDLVPMAVGLEAGAVMVAPIWGIDMEAAEERVFTVLDQEPVEVEGAEVLAWRVEERRASTGDLLATWYLTDESPYMVAAEIPLPNGQIQRMTGVALDGGGG